MSKADPMLARIEAFNQTRGGGVIVQQAAQGYSLFSAHTGAPIARLKPTGESDKVQVLWWNGERWSAWRPLRHRHHAARQGPRLRRCRTGLLDPHLSRKWPKSS
jgi:hypothetical protein